MWMNEWKVVATTGEPTTQPERPEAENRRNFIIRGLIDPIVQHRHL